MFSPIKTLAHISLLTVSRLDRVAIPSGLFSACLINSIRAACGNMNGRLFLHLCYKLCDCRQIPTLGGAVKTETQTQCSQIQIHSTVLIPPNRTATVKLAATYSVFQIHSQTD